MTASVPSRGWDGEADMSPLEDLRQGCARIYASTGAQPNGFPLSSWAMKRFSRWFAEWGFAFGDFGEPWASEARKWWKKKTARRIRMARKKRRGWA